MAPSTAPCPLLPITAWGRGCCWAPSGVCSVVSRWPQGREEDFPSSGVWRWCSAGLQHAQGALRISVLGCCGHGAGYHRPGAAGLVAGKHGHQRPAAVPVAEHRDRGCSCKSIIPGAAGEMAPSVPGGSLCPDFPIRDGQRQAHLPSQREPWFCLRRGVTSADGKTPGGPEGTSSSQTPAPKGRPVSSAGHKPPASSPGSPRRGAGAAGSLLVLSSH